MHICSPFPLYAKITGHMGCVELKRQFSVSLNGALRASNDPWRPTGDPMKTFYHRDLLITRANSEQKGKIPRDGEMLGFGEIYSDHMIDVNWDVVTGWQRPHIQPFARLEIHPGAKVLHYASELFEGMKAYRGVDGRIRLFRPELNMERMRRSAIRSTLPDFEGEELIEVIRELVRLDSAWVPFSDVASLYIRPAMIGTDPVLGLGSPNQVKLFVIAGPAGAYFNSGFQPINLLASPSAVRAWSGGVGSYKMGCNYAPTMYVSNRAKLKNCQQVLWLSGDNQWVTEAGSMNIFMFWKNAHGKDELITPSVESGLILPGITRQSLLELARQWNEFEVTERDFTMEELRHSVHKKRVYELFGTGTAVVVTPIEGIVYENTYTHSEERLTIPTMTSKAKVMQRLFTAITDIQFGKVERKSWTREI